MPPLPNLTNLMSPLHTPMPSEEDKFGNSLPDGTEFLLYKFRSMSIHIITQCGGPLSWKYVQRCRNSLSSAGKEIMAKNECVKDTISLRHHVADLDMIDIFLPTVVYNNNCACCDWAKTTTTDKGLKQINIR